jgi:hypothetical protein
MLKITRENAHGSVSVDPKFLKFLSDIEVCLNAEEVFLINFVYRHKDEDALTLLEPNKVEALKELVTRFTTKGKCHFCRKPFSWQDNTEIGYILVRPDGIQPHHSSCYPKNSYCKPPPAPQPASFNL